MKRARLIESLKAIEALTKNPDVIVRLDSGSSQLVIIDVELSKKDDNKIVITVS